MVLGWLAFQALLQLYLPGPVVEGVTLSTGARLPYKLNGHLAFWVSLPCFLPFDLYDHWLEFAFASCVVSILLSFGLYAASFGGGLLASNTGNHSYDFFMGRELNPRSGSFDFKCFCELRPGLIGWLLLDLACCKKRWESQGQVGLPLMLVTLFQGICVWDSLYLEKASLTNMDITTDGSGFMLAFGDLAWVPFTYSLQARYLVTHDPDLSLGFIVGVVVLNVLGYAIFRAATSQKDTKRGTKLSISGFWGAARKINYTGDWLMSLAWCLLTGFTSPIPYFYSSYFLVLLIHRAIRDDHACSIKYGDDWPKYKAHVPYLFIPYLIYLVLISAGGWSSFCRAQSSRLTRYTHYCSLRRVKKRASIEGRRPEPRRLEPRPTRRTARV